MSSFSNLSYTLGGGTTAFQTSTSSRSRPFNVNNSQMPTPTNQPVAANQQNMVNFAAMASPAGMTPPVMSYYSQVPSSNMSNGIPHSASATPQNYEPQYPAGTTFMQSYQLPYMNYQGNSNSEVPFPAPTSATPSSQTQNIQHHQQQSYHHQLQPQASPQNQQMACHVKIGEPNQPAVVYPAAGDVGAADTTKQEAPAQWPSPQMPQMSMMNHSGDGHQNQIAQYPSTGVISPVSKQVHFGQYPGGMEVTYGGQPVQAFFMQPEQGGTGDHSPAAEAQPPMPPPRALDPKPAGVVRKTAYEPCGKCQSCQYTSTKKERPLPSYPLLVRPPKTNTSPQK